ncbi:MAG: BatA domain-containing protein [Pirellulaceae bacterium]|nr:BatA domain-containing protein [Pirellulaceae bacterium]
MQFLFQPLTWGFMLVGVPILVHLINMLRHRKQSWAAMDFLMESYRKHRRWVLLKQWLLLASRILAMFLLVAMLARWVSSSQSLGWFGGRITHHYVLLDDSYSMSEQEKGESAYTRGLTAVQALIRAISTQPGEHQLTLLRWSRAELAARAGKEQARVDVAADLISQTIPRDASRLLDRIVASQPSSLQLSPEPAVELVAPMITSQAGEQVELYFVTDLRRNEWGQPESLKSRLTPLVRGASRIQFIDCAEPSTNNLGIVALQPEQETWAAGVPLMIKFQITNHGQLAARNVVVKVRSMLYPDGTVSPLVDSRYSGETIEAPPVVVEEIAPGETLMRQVQLVFATSGQHVVEVSLAEDRLDIDNHRWCVIGIRQSQKILVIDGSADPTTAFFLKTALQPDGRQSTGMSVDVRDAGYLRDVTPEALAEWDAVVLLEVPRLEPQAITRLEDYVKAGGGLALFAGPSSNVGVINEQYYRNGAGFFPVSIGGVAEIINRPGNTEPQVTATDHPILAPLKNLSASPFQLIEIRQMLEVTSKLDGDGKVDIVALGPDRRPLILDKSYGDGHVVAVLTGLTGGAGSGASLSGAGPNSSWSTWAQDPTFVVLSLRMMGYLGSFRRDSTSELVATPIVATFADATFLPTAEVLLPATSENLRAKLTLQLDASAPASNAPGAGTQTPAAVTAASNTPASGPTSNFAPDRPVTVKLAIDLTADNESVEALLRPGVFELWMDTTDGGKVVRNVAHNVAASEGNLARVTKSELEERLSPMKISVQSAESLSGAAWSPEGASYSTLLLVLLIAMLLIEQALAYSASYHVPKLARSGAA